MSFYNDFKKPINYIGLFLSIFGIVLSIIYGTISLKSKKINFQTDSITKIIDKELLTNKIKLVDSNKNEIIENVFLITGSIINNGDITIEESDIRIPLFIQLDSNASIIDYAITEQIDSVISKFALVKTDTNKLSVSWGFFDPKYGFKFKILCKADTKPSVMLKGKILGIKDFSSFKIDRELVKKTWFYILVFSLLFYYFMYMLELFPKFKNDFLQEKDNKIFYIQIFLYFISPILITLLCLFFIFSL